MEELSLHFSAIVDNKEELIKRLQQPFVGDYISIDANYQRYRKSADLGSNTNMTESKLRIVKYFISDML